MLLKSEHKSVPKPPQKRISTFGQTQSQIESQKLEQFVDDNCDFDSIYIETNDPTSKDLINILIDKKKLVEILVKD